MFSPLIQYVLILSLAISSIADFEYTVNLIGCAPGAKSKILRSVTFLTSTPGSEPIAFDRFEASLVTNNMLFPTFLLLPLSLDCPERDLSCFQSGLHLVLVLVNLKFLKYHLLWKLTQYHLKQ